MRIVIIGAGAVSQSISVQLGQENHDISVLDSNPEVIKHLASQVDGFLMSGNAISPSDLLRAGCKEADVVVAVTGSDETNLMCALWAKQLGKALTIARVRQPEYTDSNVKLPESLCEIDSIINPNKITVDNIIRLVQAPGATEAVDFDNGNILLRGFVVDEDAPLVGKTLTYIKSVCAMDHFLVVAIIRDDEVIIPRGDEVVQANDNIFALLPSLALPLFMPLVKRYIEDVNRVIISGATEIGMDLAIRLKELIPEVVLVDQDINACERAADKLSSIQVMCGKVTELQFLKECRINATQLFIAVANNEEENLIASLLSKQNGVSRIMTLTSNADMLPILKLVGPDVAVNPRLLTVGHILEFIRAGNVLSVFKLRENAAEVIEVEIPASSALAGKPLKETSFPKGAIIGVVSQNGQMVIPDGDTVIEAGNRIVVFTREDVVEKVERLWR